MDEYEMFSEYPDLMTPADVADVTGMNVQYVRRLCRDGELPAVHIGARNWFVPKPLFVRHVMGGNS